MPEFQKDIFLKMPRHLGVKGRGNLGSFAAWELSTNFVFSVCCSGGVSVWLNWTYGQKRFISWWSPSVVPVRISSLVYYLFIIPVSILSYGNSVLSPRISKEKIVMKLQTVLCSCNPITLAPWIMLHVFSFYAALTHVAHISLTETLCLCSSLMFLHKLNICCHDFLVTEFLPIH